MFLSRRRPVRRVRRPGGNHRLDAEGEVRLARRTRLQLRAEGRDATECSADAGSEADFTGSFTFTGENGFSTSTLPQPPGPTSSNRNRPTCSAARRAERRGSRPPRAVPFHPYVDGAALWVSTLAKTTIGDRPPMRALTASREENRRKRASTPCWRKTKTGCASSAGFRSRRPRRAFEWDFAAGTATVAPPAPFAGTATFTRRGRRTQALHRIAAGAAPRQRHRVAWRGRPSTRRFTAASRASKTLTTPPTR